MLSDRSYAANCAGGMRWPHVVWRWRLGLQPEQETLTDHDSRSLSSRAARQ
jgi:hypothetical protein